MEPWEDSRGRAGGSVRGIAHRDDAKDRRDEASRELGDTPASRLPKWAAPVGAAVSVLLVVGGTFALTRDGSDADREGSTGDPVAGAPAPSADGAPGSDQDTDEEGGAPGPVVTTVNGVTTGDITVTLSETGKGSQTYTAPLTFSLDCSAGATCVASGFEAGGELAGARENLFINGLGLAWQGGDGTWSQQGAAPAGCDDVEPDDTRAFVTGTLSVDGGSVTVLSTFDEYKFSTADAVCSGAKVVYSYTGTLS